VQRPEQEAGTILESLCMKLLTRVDIKTSIGNQVRLHLLSSEKVVVIRMNSLKILIALVGNT
jgi:hypothetical protein